MKVGFIIGIAILLDQLTKILIRHTMELGESIVIVGSFIKITYVLNPGIAFGIHVPNGFIFTILSIFASIGVVVFLVTHWHEGMAIKGSLALILGGAIGNLIDRLFFREVVDFIDVGIQNLRWPVFNIADSAVVIGMFFLFVAVFRAKETKVQSESKGE